MAERLSRRQVVVAGGGLVSAAVAGCTSDNEGNEIQDSDGDGVIDSEDYAPQDPDVQEKSDLQTTGGPTRGTATTTTASATTTTTTVRDTDDSDSETTSDSAGNTAMLSGEIPDDRTAIKRFDSEQVVVEVRDYPAIEASPARLVAFTYRYPRGEVVAYGRSETFTPPGEGESTEIAVELDEGSVPVDTRVHHLVVAIPDKEIAEVSSEEMTSLAESGAFEDTGDGVTRDEPDSLPEDISEDGFSRTEYEGSFELDFSGSTNGREWSAGMYFYKSAYSQMRSEPRGRDYDEYVAVATENGFAKTMADILHSVAQENGFEDKPVQVEFVIDFVQSLPYVTDDVSRGYDDYSKFPIETLVDANGDCEDTAILLASTLQAEPFNYDMVLIRPPGHMATGIYGDDLPGRYYTLDGREYYYIETTGTGWGIGDVPDPYVGEEAYLYQV